VTNELQNLSEHWNHPEELIGDINERFNAWIIDSGFLQGLRDHMIPVEIDSASTDKLQKKTGDYASRFIETFQYISYELIIRFTTLLWWLPYILLIAIPALFDAYNTWRINKTNFAMPDARVFYYSLKGAVFVSALMLILFFAPISMPTVAIPLYIVFVSVCLTLALSNAQKR
jgi:hypothetical protein